MTTFLPHRKDTAPEGSVAALEEVESAFGFIPNMMAVLAESPVAVKAYLDLVFGLEGRGDLSNAERQFLMIAISAENGCEYCVPAHSAIAATTGLKGEHIAAAGSGAAVDDPRLTALRAFGLTMMEKRGRASDGDVQAFLDAGFTKAQLLEVIVCLAAKTLSNYANHIAGVPLDPQFKP